MDRYEQRRRELRNQQRKEMAFVVAVIAILIFAIWSGFSAWSDTQQSLAVKVTDKQSVVNGDSSKYLVFTEGEVFENEDSTFFRKWNSSDFQGRLQVGHRYQITVVGWRIPFFSMYRNIISIDAEE